MKFITIIVAIAFIAMLSIQAGQAKFSSVSGKYGIVALQAQGEKADAEKGCCGNCEKDKDAPKDGDKDKACNGDKDGAEKDKADGEKGDGKDKAGKGKGHGKGKEKGKGKKHGKKDGEVEDKGKDTPKVDETPKA